MGEKYYKTSKLQIVVSQCISRIRVECPVKRIRLSIAVTSGLSFFHMSISCNIKFCNRSQFLDDFIFIYTISILIPAKRLFKYLLMDDIHDFVAPL